MIYGVGTDIVELARVQETYNRFGDHFVNRLLMDEERETLVERFSEALDQPIYCISSATQLGLSELKLACAKQLHDMLAAEEDACPETP